MRHLLLVASLLCATPALALTQPALVNVPISQNGSVIFTGVSTSATLWWNIGSLASGGQLTFTLANLDPQTQIVTGATASSSTITSSANLSGSIALAPLAGGLMQLSWQASGATPINAQNVTAYLESGYFAPGQPVTSSVVNATFVDAGVVKAGSASVGFLDAGAITVSGPLSASTLTATSDGGAAVSFGLSGTLRSPTVGSAFIAAGGTYLEVSNGTTYVNGTDVSNAVYSLGNITGSSLTIGSGTTLTNVCVAAQGGCSMASTATCTVACTACTTASACQATAQSNAATTDALGVQAQCDGGVVTLTAKSAAVGTETFNVACFN